MQKLLRFLLFFCLSGSAAGQSSFLIDSLEAQLKNESDAQIRMETLRQICTEHPESVARLEYSNLLLDEATENESLFYQHAAYLSRAIAYQMLGDLSHSLDDLFRSAEIATAQSDKKLLGSSYGEIANTFSQQGDLKNGIHYMNKAIEIFREIEDDFSLAIALMNTGYDYYTLEKIDSSLIYYDEAEYIIRQLETETKRKASLLAYVEGNRAITWVAQGKIDQARESLSKTIAKLRLLEDYYGITDFLIFLGQLEFSEGNKGLAIEYASEAKDIAESTKNLPHLRDASFLLYEVHDSQNNPGSALTFYKDYSAIKDRLENAESIREMADQRNSFEIGLKQAEVDLLQAQKRNQFIVLIAFALVLLVALIAVLLIYRNFKEKERLNDALEKQKKKLERLNSTKDKFFSIISHDLRGPIHAFHGISSMIKFLVISKKTDSLIELAEDIDHSVDRLSDLLDNLLNWALQEQKQIPIKPEKMDVSLSLSTLTSTYKTMADSKNIEIHADVDAGLYLWSDRNTTETIFRNLLSNALKFTPEGGQVTICAYREENEVCIEFKDTGVGIDTSLLQKLFEYKEDKSTFGTKGEKGLGLGLKLVKEFVDLNNGRIKAHSQKGQGTNFTLHLPSSHSVKTKAYAY